MARRKSAAPSRPSMEEILAAIPQLSSEDQDRIFLALCNHSDTVAGIYKTAKSEVSRKHLLSRCKQAAEAAAKARDEFRDSNTALLELLREAAEEVDHRTVKPHKRLRNERIHELRTHEGIKSWLRIREVLERENPAWVRVKKTGELISTKALENGYRDWLRSRPVE